MTNSSIISIYRSLMRPTLPVVTWRVANQPWLVDCFCNSFLSYCNVQLLFNCWFTVMHSLNSVKCL